MRFTTNVGTSELHLTGFSSPLLGSLTADNKISFSSTTPEISISTLLGSSTTSRTDVLLDELRAMCGTSFTLSGVLKGTGSYSSYTSYASPITITIGKK